jgi:hypothetical protein
MSSRVTSPINRQPHQLYTSLTSIRIIILSLPLKKKPFPDFLANTKTVPYVYKYRKQKHKTLFQMSLCCLSPSKHISRAKKEKRKSQKMNFGLELFSPSARTFNRHFSCPVQTSKWKIFSHFSFKFPCICEGCVSGVTLSITCVAVHIIYNTGRQRGHSNRREPSDP